MLKKAPKFECILKVNHHSGTSGWHHNAKHEYF